MAEREKPDGCTSHKQNKKQRFKTIKPICCEDESIKQEIVKMPKEL